jgi:hypothetical protein
VTAPDEPADVPPGSRPSHLRELWPGRQGPRNYLAGSEQRRLFWTVVPPALAVLLGLELLGIGWQPRSGAPPAGRAPQQPVDTRLEAVAGPRPEPGEVVIEPSFPVTAGPTPPRGASAEALDTVRDVAFFQTRDHAAWREIAATLRSERRSGERTATDGHPAGDPPVLAEVSFGELMGMPRSFRGRPVRIRGTLRRLEQLDPPAAAAEVGPYWQGWLEPEDGPAAPVIVHLLSLPTGMATGLNIRERVVVEGYFLKTAAYRAADGVRVAPLIVAAEPGRPRPAATSNAGSWNRSLGLVAAGTMLAVVSALGLGFLVSGRRRRGSPPADVDAALAGFEPESIEESLRRVAAAPEGQSDGAQP